jgi:hypothetical protein
MANEKGRWRVLQQSCMHLRPTQSLVDPEPLTRKRPSLTVKPMVRVSDDVEVAGPPVAQGGHRRRGGLFGFFRARKVERSAMVDWSLASSTIEALANAPLAHLRSRSEADLRLGAMRLCVVLLLSVRFLVPRGTVSAAPLILSEHAAIERLSVSSVEHAARRYLRKRPHCCRYIHKRRHSWTNYPYWRPYQYRYWKFYYPYGGPLF